MDYARYGCACAQCAAGGESGWHPEATGGPWGYTATTVIAYPYTGNYRVDVLLDDNYPLAAPVADRRWNYDDPMGTPITVTYSFMSEVPYYGGNDDIGGFGFRTFTEAQKTATRQIMVRLSEELGIDLVEVADSTFVYGQIRLGANNQSQIATAGYAWMPNHDGEKSGDVWLDYTYNPNFQVAPGELGYATLLHEIGHSLGLKHPGNYNAGESSGQEPGNYLADAEDNYNYTVMSYTDVEDFQQRDWYGIYDLLALKALYGAGSYNAGNTPHVFTDADGEVLKIINDSSGFDTIDVSALTGGAKLDMRPGTFSSVGLVDTWFAAQDNLSIDYNTTIENFVGSNYRDTVTVGNTAVSGDGGGGIDTVLFTSERAAYQASATSGTVHVTGIGADGTFTNVERLAFSDDNLLAFDLTGNAGKAARILGTIFGQGDNPIPVYSGVLLSFLDDGMGFGTLMQGAIDYHLGAHTNADLVTLIYTNLAGFAPAQDMVDYYVEFLSSGEYTEAEFSIAAAESEYADARIDIVGLMETGLEYY